MDGWFQDAPGRSGAVRMGGLPQARWRDTASTTFMPEPPSERARLGFLAVNDVIRTICGCIGQVYSGSPPAAGQGGPERILQAAATTTAYDLLFGKQDALAETGSWREALQQDMD